MPRYIIFASAGFNLLIYSIDTEAVAVVFPSPIIDTGVAEDSRLLEFEILCKTKGNSRVIHFYGEKGLVRKIFVDKIYYMTYMQYHTWKILK